jgi:hypothetical protein
MAILLTFLTLQLFDTATTLVFLGRGVTEANPLVRAAIHASANPLIALVLVKALGCGVAIFAWRSQRTRLLNRVNIFFGMCVAWNLTAILAAR